MSPRSSYHHGDLRAALVAAALELIAEKGMDSLSVAAAARKTGVSAAAPYRHFPSRQALLAAAATVAARQLVADLRAGVSVADGGQGPEEAVEALCAVARVYVRFMVSRRAGFDLIYAGELQGVQDQELSVAGREVMDALVPLAREVAGDPVAGLQLLEQLIATSHGYAMLFLNGFLSQRTDDVELIAEEAVGVVRTLAAAAASAVAAGSAGSAAEGTIR